MKRWMKAFFLKQVTRKHERSVGLFQVIIADHPDVESRLRARDDRASHVVPKRRHFRRGRWRKRATERRRSERGETAVFEQLVSCAPTQRRNEIHRVTARRHLPLQTSVTSRCLCWELPRNFYNALFVRPFRCRAYIHTHLSLNRRPVNSQTIYSAKYCVKVIKINVYCVLREIGDAYV